MWGLVLWVMWAMKAMKGKRVRGDVVRANGCSRCVGMGVVMGVGMGEQMASCGWE